jgi:hypothetical protein
MKQISSSLTGFYKRTLPMFWFGILALSTTSVLFARPDQPRPIVLLFPFGLALVGYAMAKRLYWKPLRSTLSEQFCPAEGSCRRRVMPLLTPFNT